MNGWPSMLSVLSHRQEAGIQSGQDETSCTETIQPTRSSHCYARHLLLSSQTLVLAARKSAHA